jgi:uncharacterized membrane protein YeaQ/YmgE (transglycosylase-associated protein family)
MAVIAFVFIGLVVGLFAAAVVRNGSSMTVPTCLGLGVVGAMTGGSAVALLAENMTMAASEPNAFGAVAGAALLNAIVYATARRRAAR